MHAVYNLRSHPKTKLRLTLHNTDQLASQRRQHRILERYLHLGRMMIVRYPSSAHDGRNGIVRGVEFLLPCVPSDGHYVLVGQGGGLVAAVHGYSMGLT